jgi:hypothetical protein
MNGRKRDVNVFDCNACYGIFSVPPLKRADTVADLLDEMDFCSGCGAADVHQALLHHAAQVDESPEVGNPLLSEQVAPHPQLEAAWALLPFHTGELGDLPDFLGAMRAHRVRALWAFPSKHRYLLDRTTCGDLLDEMIARRIPLFLPRGEQSGSRGGWELASVLLQDFPQLRLAMVGHGSWGEDRFFRPLLKRYEHFYVDTSRYELDGGIAEVCQLYGPERLLFGSAFPHTGMGGALLTVLHCDMPDDWKAAVAGGNLERLLAEVDLS